MLLLLVLIQFYWFGLYALLTKYIPLPKKILKEEDRKTREKLKNNLVSSVMAWLHGPVMTLWSGYIVFKNGVTYNQVSTSEHMYPMIVSLLVHLEVFNWIFCI